uniref:Zinc finger, CCHC-type n=1 Tax=Tanacetum cinerariifolium TaxID=118510 RepID=A0A6L2JTX0_TANCI|nr:zinc finger, CCHC-type [Tanacetum cinerariifolium]
MEDENPIRTLGDYSRPSHEGYRNTIELPEGNNAIPLRSNTIQLVQNGCSFYGLRSENPNQHLKDFLKLVDLLDLDGSISTWEDLATRFLAQFFLPGRTVKLRNDILLFQQHHGESLSEAWTRFRNPMVSKSITAISHDEGRNSGRKESKAYQNYAEDTSSTSTHRHKLDDMVKRSKEIKKKGKEEDEMDADIEVEVVIKEEESEFETDEEVEKIFKKRKRMKMMKALTYFQL